MKLTNNILNSGYWEGTLVLVGAGCDICMMSDNIINEVRGLQTIYSPVVIGRGLCP